MLRKAKVNMEYPGNIPIYPGNVSGGPGNLCVGQGNMYLDIKTDCTDPENV